MRKRIVFAALLCLCAALALLSTAALAETATSVIVGGKTLDGTTNIYATTDVYGAVTAQPSYTESDQWNIKFQNGVLTLKGATVAGVTQYYGLPWETNYAIYAAGELRLVLEGANTVYSTDTTVANAGIVIDQLNGTNNGSLTIEGVGSLNAFTTEGGKAYQGGICVSGVLNVEGGIITAQGKNTANDSYGVKAINGFTMTGGTLTASGGDATGKYSFSAGIDTESITISGGTVIATAGTATLSSIGLCSRGNIVINASANGAISVTAKTTDTTARYHSALNQQPTLSDGAVYSWRTDERGQSTSSEAAPYVWVNGGTFTELVLAQACATPVITPDAGTYLLPQSVTFTCATQGAVIRYTTDGTEPTKTSAAYTAGTPIVIAATTTVKAKAFQAGSSLSGTAAATYTITGSAPVIATQPSNQVVTAGSTATFTIAATGNPTPSYQWQFSTDGGTNWNNLPGSTSASCTLPAVTSAMSGYQYRCAVSNGFLSAVTSSAAKLTVNPLHFLTVVDGTGSGEYTAGTRVSITADAPPLGQQFKAWVITSGGGSIAASTNATTEYVMPDNAATVTATYEAVIVPPKTGDNSNPLLWLGMCLLSGIGVMLAIRQKRRA